jgi:hypothetical protein
LLGTSRCSVMASIVSKLKIFISLTQACLPLPGSHCFLDGFPLFSIGLHFVYPGTRFFFDGQ